MTETRHLDDDTLLHMALGELGQPDHDHGVEHLTGCLRCRNEYDHVAGGIDLVLPAALRLSAPAGFETQVLDRMRYAPTNVTPAYPSPPADHRRETPLHRRMRPAVLTAAAGAFGVAVGLVGATLLWPPDSAPADPPLANPDQAVVLTDQADTHIGWVAEAYGASGDMLVITLDDDPAGARLTCRGVLADGTTEDLGSWYTEGGQTSTWVIENVPEHIEALELVDDSGNVHAAAELNP